MNMRPVSRKPTSVHEVIDGKAKCGTPMTDKWIVTDKPVTCAHCLGVVSGWKADKRNYKHGHFGVVARNWNSET